MLMMAIEKLGAKLEKFESANMNEGNNLEYKRKGSMMSAYASPEAKKESPSMIP